MRRDEDTLDTWFSSALWPFSTLGWPENTADLDYFYPTDVLVTGYDIIFFWVARMIFSGIHHTGQTPFKHVLIHGLVRASDGRKMSKSLNNGIDPLEVIDQYGADALRFSLAAGNAPGNDMRFYWEKVESGRNFANKLWNAARFILTYLDDAPLPALEECTLQLPDRWMLHRLNDIIAQATDNLEAFELGLYAQNLYDFIWTSFCDWYIELCKPALQGEDGAAKGQTLALLCHVLSRLLELLHPMMPFVTEEIWQHLPHEAAAGDTIMLTQWPQQNAAYEASEDAARMESLMDIIRAIRNLRAERNVPPGRKASLYIATQQPELFAQNAEYLARMAAADKVKVLESGEPAPANSLSVIAAGSEVFIPLAELVDLAQEKARLEKELKNLDGEITRAQGKLGNEGFMAKAPPALVEEEKAKLEQFRVNRETLVKRLGELG